MSSGIAKSILMDPSTVAADGGRARGSWFEGIGAAWASTMDQQAAKIQSLGDTVRSGVDQPSLFALLTAESLKFSFLAQAEQSSTNAIGSAMEAMGRKQ